MMSRSSRKGIPLMNSVWLVPAESYISMTDGRVHMPGIVRLAPLCVFQNAWKNSAQRRVLPPHWMIGGSSGRRHSWTIQTLIHQGLLAIVLNIAYNLYISIVNSFWRGLLSEPSFLSGGDGIPSFEMTSKSVSECS